MDVVVPKVRHHVSADRDLTVMLGLFDRKVIGWALSADRETCPTTIPALEMAVRNRRP